MSTIYPRNKQITDATFDNFHKESLFSSLAFSVLHWSHTSLLFKDAKKIFITAKPGQERNARGVRTFVSQQAFSLIGLPLYFNITHAYEYVYNTAHLTTDGFQYWNDRGFMQRDFTPDFVDAFVRGWKQVTLHAPSRPCRTTAYLSEIPSCDDRYERFNGSANIYNISEVGLGYLYETSRLCGLPAGFVLSWEALEGLQPDDTDLVILPSLRGAPQGGLNAIRRLYKDGVSLIAVSEVCGLEDLFGVVPRRRTKMINRLCCADGEEEYILPEKAEFLYDARSAEIVLYASCLDGTIHEAAVFQNSRTMLINAPLPCLGRSYYTASSSMYRENISPLMRKVLGSLLIKLSDPAALSESYGITLFDSRQGDTLLLAIDYSRYDASTAGKMTESTILLSDSAYLRAESLYGAHPEGFYENGVLRGIYLKLRYEECALIRLVRKQESL